MKTSPTQRRLWIFVLGVAILSGGALQAKDDLRLRARLVGPGGNNALKGKADYKLRESRSRRKLNIEVENGTPGNLLDVLVAGEVVGTIEINALGYGKLEFDDRASSSNLFFGTSGSGRGDDDSDSDSDDDSDGDDDSDSDSDDDSDDDDDSDSDSDDDSDDDDDSDSDSDDDSDGDDDSDSDSDDDSDDDDDSDSDSDDSSSSGSGSDDSGSDDSGGSSGDDDFGGAGSTMKEPFPSNFPSLNGGELIQVGPLSGTFQIKD